MEGERVAEKRRGRRKGLVVTDRDVDILKLIHDYRLLRIEQIVALTGRTYTRIHRRLKGLFDAGFLKRRELPQKKDIYYIARPGLAVLLSHGRVSDEQAERRSREHELKPATLDHEMMIADIHIALELATREGPMKITLWDEGEAIRDTFDVTDSGGTRRVTINPDALFRLKDTRRPESGNSRIFFLEADRSSMLIVPREGSQRFRDKIERYCSWIDTGRPFKTYDVQTFRVVTVTLTRERRDNLSADTEAFLTDNGRIKQNKFFLFGSQNDTPADPQAILTPMFRRPGDPNPQPLFPPLAEKAERA